jgi:hypothetical protein
MPTTIDSAETALAVLSGQLDNIRGGNRDRHVRLNVDRAYLSRQVGYLKFNLLGVERREVQ